MSHLYHTMLGQCVGQHQSAGANKLIIYGGLIFYWWGVKRNGSSKGHCVCFVDLLYCSILFSVPLLFKPMNMRDVVFTGNHSLSFVYMCRSPCPDHIGKPAKN